MSGSHSEIIAAFSTGLRCRDIPAAVVANATKAIVDTLAVTVAGASTEVGRIVKDLARTSTDTRIGVTLGERIETSQLMAAFANGSFAHALDFDDDDPLFMVGHPSAPVVSALISISHFVKPTGLEFLLAYIAGVELEMRLGAAINPEHYDRGWHATSTLGALGAALACAKLGGLDQTKTCTAIGVASSMAAGIRANFGTMTKPMHVGNAAQTGVLAASLAANGLSASRMALEHPVGYTNAFSGVSNEVVAKELSQLGSDYALLDPGLATKQYPCCSNTHPALDLYFDLSKENSFGARDVASVTCFVSPGTERILLYENPQTGLEGKFSMEYCLAVAIACGRVTPDDFVDSAIHRLELREAIDKTSMRIDGTIVPGKYGVSTAVRLHIRLHDGREIIASRDRPKGCVENPLTRVELATKFHACCDSMLGEAQSAQAFDVLYDLENLKNMGTALDLLSVSPSSLQISETIKKPQNGG